MILEARAANCFSTTYVLNLDGHPLGKLETRLFSEGLDVSLLGRRQLEFGKTGWLGSHFVLRSAGGGEALAEADRAGVFTSAWGLRLSCGPARLERAGWLDTGYVVRQGETDLARVDRVGWCERGWAVGGLPPLTQEDLLLVGLVYHTVLRRQAQSHSAGHAAGS